MTDKIQHIDAIFRLLKKQMAPYGTPIVSKKKQGIPETPFVTLISCLLSLRTKDEVTADASRRLLTKYHTPGKIVQLTEKQIETMVYPVGFYKTKARRIKEISQTLLEKYQGNVPDTIEELLTLKGVGRKTANIVMVYGHRKHGYLPIDTHCHRIPNRLGWIKTKTPEETEQALIKILPPKYWDDFNDLFVRFGQTICVPISPYCSVCSLQKYCKKVGVLKSR
ncbi:MAG: endonuclease III [Candidatus Thermoplasmatota archaeon]|nr:endonuclease III [Candidatus Thermoplasmatota archaeon]